MLMEILLTPAGVYALATVLLGVAAFWLAPALPAMFPPSIIRLVGFAAICAAMAPLSVMSGGWHVPALVGGCAMLLLVLAHWRQTRRHDKM